MSDADEKAAAMDALNLDDLFLGGEDDEQGADSLFADMDIDLGDIMDGIIGDTGGNISGIMTEEFGDGDDIADIVADDDGPDLDLFAEDLDVSATTSSNAEVEKLDSSSSTRGKGKTKSRTARSNPHLAMAQQQEESKSKQPSASALLSDHAASQILSPTAKRKRRKSKKVGGDDDEYVPGESASASAYAANANKKSKKEGRSHRHRSKLPTRAASDASAPITGTASSTLPSLDTKLVPSREQSLSSTLPTPTSQSTTALQPPVSSAALELEKAEKAKQLLLKQEQESISKFGLKPSRTLFFPYMNLPAEVDVKKRGQKLYPCLEKLNGFSDSRNAPPSSSPEDGGSPSSQDKKHSVTLSSPLFKLFEEHLGALTDNHGNQHPPQSLCSSLVTAVQHSSSYTKVKKKKHQQKAQALIDELSKVYVGCIKQSAFLRQNIWNMENWCKDHLDKEDFKSVSDVKRRDVEWVLRMMQQMKQRRLQQQQQQRLQQQLQQQKLQQQKLLQQQQLQQQKEMAQKRVAPDKRSLPFPENMPSAPNHGGPHTTPVTSIKVKVKVAGWRDKSGTKLTARLWTPVGWKVALKRVENHLAALRAGITEGPMAGGAGSTTPGVGAAGASLGSSNISSVPIAIPPAPTPILDVSSVVSKATLAAVASELVRPDLMPKSSPKGSPKISPKSSPKIGSPVDIKPTGSSSSTVPGTSTQPPVAKTSTTPATTTSSAAISTEKKKEEEKKKTRKRKAKDATGIGGTSSAANAAGSSVSTSSGRPSKRQQQQQLIPHVPSYDRPRYQHPAAILSPSMGASLGRQVSIEKDTDIHKPQQNSHRILHYLYSQILHPSLSPTERRTLLANEIFSTLTRLEHARQMRQTPKFVHIQKQVQELQSVYNEDIDIVPEHNNTIGMWNWMKKNNYFDNLDNAEDVYDFLGGCWQPELEEEEKHGSLFVDENEEERCWGNYLALPSNKVIVEDDEGSVADGVPSKKEESPLFDRLQSLLVEADDESDEDDDDDDDYLISSLPEFSPDEFIHGPQNNNNQKSLVSDGAESDSDMLDVSALTLDQRTYIQLRAAGLIDAKTPFLHCNSHSPSSSTTRTTNNKRNTEDSVDVILSKMKSTLSTLHVQTNSNVATLQRKALTHVAGAPKRQQRQNNDEAILAKYKQLQKVQMEQREEKQRQIRTSGRVKTGSNKFDGEQWLPW
mmetsp:Transcript_38968/g.81911  ORF Transcript_38968/g.81911 Transcript_38968/m.81911 type:complete len:1191 (-) Transcript_38968:84-3656(-)